MDFRAFLGEETATGLWQRHHFSVMVCAEQAKSSEDLKELGETEKGEKMLFMLKSHSNCPSVGTFSSQNPGRMKGETTSLPSPSKSVLQAGK